MYVLCTLTPRIFQVPPVGHENHLVQRAYKKGYSGFSFAHIPDTLIGGFLCRILHSWLQHSSINNLDFPLARPYADMPTCSRMHVVNKAVVWKR